MVSTSGEIAGDARVDEIRLIPMDQIRAVHRKSFDVGRTILGTVGVVLLGFAMILIIAS